ncbi:hypothetical protein OIU85_004036 [Salix viminalis]|uniref:DUF4283 domain-containing protein n=1 Tax=Salix viminalis TaxID=40686 RepID=A0A9Q0PSF2_SALVM|nr:hypothetical protein OIU85_004036 [Salix viminalis]
MTTPTPRSGNQQPQGHSWADKVRVTDSSTRCKLEQLSRQPAGTILEIPKDMTMANMDAWEKSMIGFFVSYKLPYHAIHAIANRIWKAYGLQKVTVMTNGFMVFQFNTVEMMEEVLARGPWMFGGKAILLQAWQPGFQFDRNKIKTLPVWARLQGLPFPLWTKKGLSMAASMVGKPLACDEATLQGSRLEYARVCIEIDATMPLVHRFQVASSLTESPITIDVSYEWKPSRCNSCKVFGHSCKAQVEKTSEDKEKKDKEKSVDKGKSQVMPMAEMPSKVPEQRNLAMVIREEDSSSSSKDSQQVVITKVTDAGGKTVELTQDKNEGGLNRKDKQKLICVETQPNYVESKLDSVATGTVSRGKEVETSGSSTSGGQSHNGISTLSPKHAKKRKGGRKKKGGSKPPLDVFGLLETRVMVNNLAAVQANILPPHWAAITNIHANPLCRIIVGWNTKKLTIRSIQATAQWITCEVSNHLMLSGLRLTFVYGSNNYVERTALWNYMQTASVDHASIPWAIMGDFNAVLKPIDRSGGSNSWLKHHEEFPECIEKSSLHQIPYSGIHLTWHNGQTGENTIMKKLDWAFGNYAFQVRWQAAKVFFLPRQESDHSAVILRLAVNLHQETPSFKFLNQWTEHEDFMDIVRNVWQHRIVGVQATYPTRFIRPERHGRGLNIC